MPGNGLVKASGKVKLIALQYIVGDRAKIKAHHDDGMENIEHHILTAYSIDRTYSVQQVESLVHLSVLFVAQVVGRMRDIIPAVGIEMFYIAHFEFLEEVIRNYDQTHPKVIGESDILYDMSRLHNAEIMGLQNIGFHVIFYFNEPSLAKCNDEIGRYIIISYDGLTGNVIHHSQSLLLHFIAYLQKWTNRLLLQIFIHVCVHFCCKYNTFFPKTSLLS